MEMPGISVLVWLSNTTEYFFRDLLESLVSQNYDKWELYVLDENPGSGFERIVSEFFPEDARAHYRRLTKHQGKAYAYNIGFHYVMSGFTKKGDDLSGNYIYFVGQHDRLQPDAFLQIAGVYNRLMSREGAVEPGLIYTDSDFLVESDRLEPHFRPELDVELLRHCNYIGDYFLVSCTYANRLREFSTQLQDACMYDFLLRLVETDCSCLRIPMLLYHERKRQALPKKEEKLYRKRYMSEHSVAAAAALKRQDIAAGEFLPHSGATPREDYWSIPYVGRDVETHQKEFLFLHDKSVRPFSRNNLSKMYGYLRQKDVAVVGARFLKAGFTVENCGFIYDGEGNIYPAFYDQKIYHKSYENYGVIPHETAMVDPRYCMIDAKVYRKLGGFDAALSGREQMLDFCFRARAVGLRVIVDPGILVRSSGKADESSEASHELFMEKWGGLLAAGDWCYNPNLPMGLKNFSLDML